MKSLVKMLEDGDFNDEKKVMQVFKKHQGVGYRAWFSDLLISHGWEPVLRVKRNLNSWRLLRSPKGKMVDPFKGYRKSISYAVSKMNKPGFYFVLNWGVMPSQKQLDRLREVIKEFDEQEKELCLFRLERLGSWLVLVGRKNTIVFTAKRGSIDKKYFEGIYEADEENDYFIEVDIDIHNHSDTLNVSSGDRNYARGADTFKRFFTVTYQEGFAPFTSRGRMCDSKKRQIVIPWDKIGQELRKSV